jgi:phage baseplate assembly protein W
MSYTLSLTNGEINQERWTLALPYRSGTAVRGIHKLAQDFLQELMTQQGSVLFHSDYGSRLPSELIGLNNSSLQELQSRLNLAIQDVKRNMLSRVKSTDPADEILAAVSVLTIQQDYDRAVVSLEIQSAAGESVTVEHPVDWNNESY